MIYFDGPVVRLPEWKVLAVPAPLDEEYTITLRVQVRQALDDEATTEARCWVLINEIEQAVRGNLRLGGLLRGLSFGEQSVEGVPLSDGWIVHGIVPLVCTAHI
jgi:hypothetical protein